MAQVKLYVLSADILKKDARTLYARRLPEGGRAALGGEWVIEPVEPTETSHGTALAKATVLLAAEDAEAFGVADASGALGPNLVVSGLLIAIDESPIDDYERLVELYDRPAWQTATLVVGNGAGKEVSITRPQFPPPLPGLTVESFKDRKDERIGEPTGDWRLRVKAVEEPERYPGVDVGETMFFFGPNTSGFKKVGLRTPGQHWSLYDLHRFITEPAKDGRPKQIQFGPSGSLFFNEDGPIPPKQLRAEMQKNR